MKSILSLLLLCIALPLRAESVKITNRQADELLATLISIEDGLSVVNTTLVADNINELRPKVDAYSKGNVVAQRKHKIAFGVTKNDDPEFLAYLDDIQQNQDAIITVDLARITISDEEIGALKVRPGSTKPGVLSILRLYLKPKKP